MQNPILKDRYLHLRAQGLKSIDIISKCCCRDSLLLSPHKDEIPDSLLSIVVCKDIVLELFEIEKLSVGVLRLKAVPVVDAYDDVTGLAVGYLFQKFFSPSLKTPKLPGQRSVGQQNVVEDVFCGRFSV